MSGYSRSALISGGALQAVFLLVQGTDYHRVIPTRDINTKSRDKFWQQTEKEEIKRKEAEMKRLQEEKQRAEQERKEREVGWTPLDSKC